MELLKKISDEEVKQLPKICYEGEITVIEDYKEQNLAAEYLMANAKVIGFDTESRASFQKGVVNKIALLQLYGADRGFLIRLNKVKLSQGILKLFQSKNHLKVGLAIKEDLRELLSVAEFKPVNFFDLQKVMVDLNIGELGLKKISALVLGIQISKAQRLSNWEAITLTESQLRYAATDAWVSQQIFSCLKMDKEIIKKGVLIYNNKTEARQKTLARERRRLLAHRLTEEE